jgi:hypothetical protein
LRLEGGRRVAAFAAVAALPVLLCLPAVLLVAEKSRDRRPVLAGYPYAYRDITEYYTTINLEKARLLAELQVAILAGLEAVDKVTPPGARVMWMRPEYVALLGRRRAVPFYYSWSPRVLAQEVKRSKTDYLVASRLFKTDLDGVDGDPFVTMRGILAYSRPVFHFGDDTFVLMKVDPAALDAFLRAAG